MFFTDREAFDVILDLKSIFLCEGSVLERELVQDMSETAVDGVKPFVLTLRQRIEQG